MEPTTLVDPYPMITEFPGDWSHEHWDWEQVPCNACGGTGVEGYVTHEMAIDAGDRVLEGQPLPCSRCGGDGWLLGEDVKTERCCEDGWLPLPDGGAIECHICGVREH